MEWLHFIAQVEAGLKDVDAGRVISNEDRKKRIRQWRAFRSQRAC